MASAGGVLALYSAFNSLISSLSDFGKASIQAYSSFETLQTGLTNLMKNMGAGENAGNELFESLRKFSLKTTFGVDTLASASQQLLTVGESTDNLQNRILQLGNIAGGSTEKFNRLVEVFTKIKATGKATGIQMNQLSMITGVSFVQALGKTNASAEELEELFQRLTESGGQFEGAMDSLNDTISGKMEFVTSTWTEFLASFSDVTGIADIAKSALDSVYDVLQNVVDGLNGISDNPLAKSILDGVLVSVLGGIASLLVGLMIPAIWSTVSSIGALTAGLTALKMALPVAGAISLAIGGIVGLTTAISKYNSEQRAIATEEYEKQTQGYRDRIEVLKNLTDAEIREHEAEWTDDWGSYSIDDTMLRRAEEYYLATVRMDDAKKLLQKSFSDNGYYEQMGYTFDSWLADDNVGQTEKNMQGWSDLTAKLKETEEEYNRVTEAVKRLKDEQKALNLFNSELINAQNTYNENLAIVQNWYKTTNAGKAEVIQSAIADAEALLQGYQKKMEGVTLGNAYEWVRPDTETSKLINDYIEALRKQLTDLNAVPESVNTKKTWREFWKEVTGVDVTGKKGSAVSDLTNTTIDGIIAKEKELGDVLGNFDEGKNIDKWVDAYANWIETLYLERDIDSPFALDEASIQGLIAKYNELVALQTEYNEKKKKENSEKIVADIGEENTLIANLLEIYSDIEEVNLRLSAINEGVLDENYEEWLFNKKTNDLLKARLSGRKAELELIKKTALEEKDINGYLKAQAESQFLNAYETSDFKLMMDVTEKTGDPLEAILTVIASDLIEILGGMEGVSYVLNPIKEMLEEFEPLFKTVMAILGLATKGLVTVANVLMNFLDKITGGFFTTMAGMYDEMVKSNEIKDEQNGLIEALMKLRESIEKQEEYYIQQKMGLNSRSAMSITPVNDMILTDKGVFSTSPQDTIMAMKNPESLMGTGNVKVFVQDYSGSNVDVTSRNVGGETELYVKISKKVASDYALGINGWDSADISRQNRMRGRKVTV